MLCSFFCFGCAYSFFFDRLGLFIVEVKEKIYLEEGELCGGCIRRFEKKWKWKWKHTTNMSLCWCVTPFQFQFQPRIAPSSSSLSHSQVRGTSSTTLSLRPFSPPPTALCPKLLLFQPKLKRSSTTIRCSSGTVPPLPFQFIHGFGNNETSLTIKPNPF